jgi:short-subunit dehydrogenase involved in D-alanine esterification of teichoic acids
MGPEYEFDLSRADEEIDINIRGPMHLSVLLVQKHFSKLKDGAVIMNVSSVLGFNPFSVINPVYNGTKAWVHMFTTNLRTQLGQLDDGKGGKIKVVEIVPPQVESDLHRDRTDPDDNKKHKSSSAMSVEEFIKDVEEGWEKDLDTIAPGVATKSVTAWEDTMGKVYKEMTSK